MADSRIRVLVLVGSARAGGVETFVLELARHIDRLRFALTIWIMGSDGPVVEELRAAGAEVRVLALGSNKLWPSALSYFRYMRAGRFDVLHTNIGGRLPRYLARLARCRVVIMHVHGPANGEVDGWRIGQGQASFGTRIRSNYVRGAHYMIACSKAVSHSLIACCPDIRDRIAVIYCGVDTVRFKPTLLETPEVKALRQEFGLSAGDPVVGFVGRLVPQKGLPYLVAAAEMMQARYPNLRVLIVGDGPLEAELRAITTSFAKNPFLFLGERSDVPNLLSLVDVLAVPSEWEPFGIVNLEAMAMAKPVVAFDIDGIPEAILHGKTGLLVPHGDIQALARSISNLLDNVVLRRHMGDAGRERVEQTFDARAMTRTIEAFYDRTLSRRRRVDQK